MKTKCARVGVSNCSQKKTILLRFAFFPFHVKRHLAVLLKFTFFVLATSIVACLFIFLKMPSSASFIVYFYGLFKQTLQPFYNNIM